MFELQALSRRHQLPLIEDAACATGSGIRDDKGNLLPIGKPFGAATCFSFHPRKLLVTGDGGMMTTDQPDLHKRFMSLRQHCMSVNDLDRHRSQTVITEAYTDTGYNYRMTDIQAAVGRVQLARLDSMPAQRRDLAKCYYEKLESVDEIRTLHEAKGSLWNVQTFQVQIQNGVAVADIMAHLKRKEIETRRAVRCAHLEDPYRMFWHNGDTLSVLENWTRTGLTLPMHYELDESVINRVAQELKAALVTN